MIFFENVTKLYKSVIGVNDINLSLEPGAYGLLGPNGSGKTTLINLILGQLRPTIGQIKIFGDDPWNNDAMLQRVGICPAVDVLYPNVSALDWVCYLAELHGSRGSLAMTQAKQALEMVGMSHAMARPMGSYSLGMRQRTKLAQAFVHQPDLLILDEPFNGLDPVGRMEMTDLLRSFVREGRSILLASHILYEVEAIRPSFLLICGGRLLASGSPEEVRSMLADVPNDVRISCDHPRRLAQLAASDESVESLRIEDHGATLVLSTKHPLKLYERLPQWLSDVNVHVRELRSSDESLQELFTSLLRIHRGEI